MIEEKIGIKTYITSERGIGGKIKESPESFRVEEIAEIKLGEGNNLVIRVEKRNWDTLNFVRILSNILGISRKRIGFAGTKDKRSVSIQYFSISNADEKIIEKLRNVRLRDVKIEIVGFSPRKIDLGDLIGNKFQIIVKEIERNGEAIEKIEGELKEKGIPNFFGKQRFGTLRYITHEVGKQIVLKNYEEAFWIYVAKPVETENEEVRKIREDLWNERDPVIGLREFPKHLIYERTLLQKLREGKSELEALLSLPKSLKMMFVHAYQSYLFNLILSERIIEFKTLKKIELNDFVDFKKVKEFAIPAEETSVVRYFNRRRIEFLLSKGYAFLALPLPGYETELTGWSGEKLKELLEIEGVRLKDFKGEYPEFTSKGGLRVADIPFDFENFRYSVREREAEFEFFLPKGCFATTFLREFLKEE